MQPNNAPGIFRLCQRRPGGYRRLHRLDNPARAVSFIREMRERIRPVGANSLIYRLRPELDEGARMAVLGRYVILFRVSGDLVRIERVVYGGRDLLALLQQE